MKPSESADALTRYVEGRAGPLQEASLADMIVAVVGFYAGQPAVGLSDDENSDMLLFQYGCYNWGEGEMFEFDITRQFIDADGDDDDAFSQLRFTAYYEPDAALRAMPAANRWCKTLDELADFQLGILSSPALALVKARRPATVKIDWERV
jgi:hypothetical protein